MSPIKDFIDSAMWIVRTSLKERYNREVEPKQVDVEMRLESPRL